MTPVANKTGTVTFRDGDIERRFAFLLKLMRKRCLESGYELDDVHLAEILQVHEGVLRKGKTVSVSPSLARAVGQIWGVDLNWLLLGRGNSPDEHGPVPGMENLARETRIARGRWDDHRVRSLMRGSGLSQADLARKLNVSYTRAGALARGQLRDAGLREKFAGLLKLPVEELFLRTDTPVAVHGEQTHADAGEGEFFSLSAIRRAMSRLLGSALARELRSEGADSETPEFTGSVVNLVIPPAPNGLSDIERRRYEHNREVLERWSETSAAFEVPPEVAGRYCREVVGFYEGGALDDVGGVLRDFIQENKIPGGAAAAESQGEVRLKDGVLMVGGTVIEVDDPELLARIPEYLGTSDGRRRLLDWLRRNVAKD